MAAATFWRPAAGVAGGALLAVAGLVAGAALGGGSPPTSTVSAPTATTTPPVAGPPMIGNTLVEIADVRVGPSEVAVDYELIGLSPAIVAVPWHWQLIMGDGTVTEGRISTDHSRSVLFRPDRSFTAGDVAAVTVTSYGLRQPAVYEVELPLDGRAVELLDGTAVSLLRVIEQSTGTIVQLDMVRPDDVLGSDATWARAGVEAVDEDWSGFVTTFPGGTGFRQQLMFHGGALPDSVRLRVTSAAWVPVPADLRIDLETDG